MPLFVGRLRSLKAMESALLQDRKIFVVGQKDNTVEDPENDGLYRVGTLCNILQVVRVSDGTTKVLVEGVSRMRAQDYFMDGDILTAHVEPMPWNQTDFTRLEPWRRRVLDSFERYNALQPRIPGEVMASIAEMDDLVQLINLMGERTRWFGFKVVHFRRCRHRFYRSD